MNFTEIQHMKERYKVDGGINDTMDGLVDALCRNFKFKSKGVYFSSVPNIEGICTILHDY